jgi:uncharacterized protein (DUF2267 family)
MSENGNQDPLSTIKEAHGRIDAWFETTRSVLASEEAASACAQLRDALETHFAQEEDLYFPTLWQLRPDFEKSLRGLIAAHAVYLEKVDRTAEFIGAGRIDAAVTCFEELQKLFAAHEIEEEETLLAMR